MSMNRNQKATRYPLHVTIAAAFTALLLVVGVALISFNYYESRKIALLGADDLLERSSAHVHSDIQKLYKPAQNLVDVSSKVLTAHDDDLEGRLENLAFLAEPFHMSSTISSIFVAYANGDFFLVRPLRDEPRAREALAAPPRATIAVQSIETRGEMNPLQHLLFFDEDLVLLEQRPVDWTGFDARERGWYAQAMATERPVTSEFYVFFTTREVGITFARQLDDGGAVVGVDVALGDLERGLARLRVTPSSKIAILDETGSVIALSDNETEVPLIADPNESIDMPDLTSLEDPVYHRLGELFDSGVPTGRRSLEVLDRVWLASFSKLPTRRSDIYLAVLIPRDELLADVIRVRNHSVLISIGLVIAALAIVIGISRHISGSLRALSGEAQSIRDFKLDTPITVHSRIREVDDLAATMGVMKSSIQEFLAISRAMSGEKDYRRLLGMILAEARNVSRADAGAILLRADDDNRLQVAILEIRAQAIGDDDAPVDGRFAPVELGSDIDSGGAGIDRYVAVEGKTVRIDDVAADRRFDFRDFRVRFDGDGLETASALCVPLRDQLGEVIGVLQLVKFVDRAEENGGNGTPAFSPEIVPYIEALSSSAAVAIDVRRLLKAQRDLMDSLVLMVAGAIDAKSPYTHGHCRRVPVIARMLAEAAHASEGGPFSEFDLSDDEWYELHLSSWLHDCGKVTTPEYVVDKATKLETIYNRIHEIRTRFEVLWRDAELDYHKARAEGVIEEALLHEQLTRRLDEIRGDFEFIAGCNLGDQPMTPERTERLGRIADQSWVRHLDDSLGLSHLEVQNKGESSELPAIESLLADKSEHIIARADEGGPFGGAAHDFRMDVPEHLYNRGEIHNLCIPRGTLTTEERFKINEHVVQSIRMLRNLPFPRELRRVPDWAGNHHEKLDGTGYPRRLSASQLSTPERVMAVADIFEALTAADRPYHAPKTLSKTVAIMSFMCKDGHICPDLFALLLESGVYLEYAKQYMKPDQIDDVDITAIVSSLRAISEEHA